MNIYKFKINSRKLARNNLKINILLVITIILSAIYFLDSWKIICLITLSSIFGQLVYYKISSLSLKFMGDAFVEVSSVGVVVYGKAGKWTEFNRVIA